MVFVLRMGLGHIKDRRSGVMSFPGFPFRQPCEREREREWILAGFYHP